jgi:diacylglycerol O-acyltransferase
MTTWGESDTLNELEATMWRAERHPQNSTQGGVLQIFAQTPSWEDVVRLHAAGVERFPRFKQRILEPAAPVGSPVWVPDENFDLMYHLRRVRLPEPGSIRDLLDTAQALGATPLARSRALWAGTFIEGLEGGGSAYFMAVHHCLMDGHASIQLMSKLQQLKHNEPPQAHDPAGKAQSPAGGIELAARQTAGRVGGLGRYAATGIKTAANAVKAGPIENAKFAASVARVLAPPPASGSTLLASGTRTSWRYGVLECGLDELKRAGKAAGGTLNDAYVSAILGGLRRYHEAVNVPIGDITINIPVSLRRDGDAAGGNRFATAFISAPSSERDPVTRIRKLGESVGAVRDESALDFFSLLLPILNRAPASMLTPLFISMQNRADLTVSNVPGMAHEVRFLGVPVTAMYYFGPLPGSPVMVVLHSQNGRCFIGINCDGEVFPDPEKLFSALQDGLDEVLAV